MPRTLRGVSAILACVLLVQAAAAPYTSSWVLNENVVSFYQPANVTLRGGNVAPVAQHTAKLVNTSYPGPAVWVQVNELVNVTLTNQLLGEVTTIHWHGIHQVGTPWADGSDGVTQCAVAPSGGRYRYEFRPDKAGTYFWHSHVGMQMDSGMVGPLIVTSANDPHRWLYDAELPAGPLLVAEWYRDPAALLKQAPAAPALDFNNPPMALLNGWGGGWMGPDNGAPGSGFDASLVLNRSDFAAQAGQPPVIEVVRGMCYRLRFICANGDFPGWEVSVAGHDLVVMALDAHDLAPVRAKSFVFYGGNRVDAVLCADAAAAVGPSSAAGNGTAGSNSGGGGNSTDFVLEFASVHQNSGVCPWYPGRCRYRYRAILRYTTWSPSMPPSSAVPRDRLAAVPRVPGDGALDVLRTPQYIVPLNPRPIPRATRSLRVKIGFLAQSGPAGTLAYAHASKRSFQRPLQPLLLTGGSCGLQPDTHIESVSSPDEVVEVVLDNLTDHPHNMHLHGGSMAVLASSGVVVDTQWQGDMAANASLCSSSPAALLGTAAAAVQLGTPAAAAAGSSMTPLMTPSEIIAAAAQLVSAQATVRQALQPEHADPAWAAKSAAAFRRFWGCPFGNTTLQRALLLNDTAAALAALQQLQLLQQRPGSGGAGSNVSADQLRTLISAFSGGGLGSSSSSSSSSLAQGPAGAAPRYYESDVVMVPARGWTVVRIKRWSPGVWMFHCHVNHHALRGMAFLFNVLPKPGTAGNPLPLPHPSASMMGWLAAAPDALACASCRSPLGPGVTAGGASLSDPHRPKASTAVLDVLLVVLGVALGVAATLTIIGFSRRHAAPGPGPQMQPGVSDADFKHVKPGGGAPLPPNNAVGQGVSGVTVEEEHNPTNGEESSHPAVVGERESLLLRSTLRSNAPYTVQGHV